MGPFQHSPLISLGIRPHMLDSAPTPLALWDLKVDNKGFAKSRRPLGVWHYSHAVLSLALDACGVAAYEKAPRNGPRGSTMFPSKRRSTARRSVSSHTPSLSIFHTSIIDNFEHRRSSSDVSYVYNTFVPGRTHQEIQSFFQTIIEFQPILNLSRQPFAKCLLLTPLARRFLPVRVVLLLLSLLWPIHTTTPTSSANSTSTMYDPLFFTRHHPPVA